MVRCLLSALVLFTCMGFNCSGPEESRDADSGSATDDGGTPFDGGMGTDADPPPSPEAADPLFNGGTRGDIDDDTECVSEAGVCGGECDEATVCCFGNPLCCAPAAHPISSGGVNLAIPFGAPGGRLEGSTIIPSGDGQYDSGLTFPDAVNPRSQQLQLSFNLTSECQGEVCLESASVGLTSQISGSRSHVDAIAAIRRIGRDVVYEVHGEVVHRFRAETMELQHSLRVQTNGTILFDSPDVSGANHSARIELPSEAYVTLWGHGDASIPAFEAIVEHCENPAEFAEAIPLTIRASGAEVSLESVRRISTSTDASGDVLILFDRSPATPMLGRLNRETSSVEIVRGIDDFAADDGRPDVSSVGFAHHYAQSASTQTLAMVERGRLYIVTWNADGFRTNESYPLPPGFGDAEANLTMGGELFVIGSLDGALHGLVFDNAEDEERYRVDGLGVDGNNASIFRDRGSFIVAYSHRMGAKHRVGFRATDTLRIWREIGEDMLPETRIERLGSRSPSMVRVSADGQSQWLVFSLAEGSQQRLMMRSRRDLGVSR